MSKTALVLSSGGAKGIAHIGAIQALEEKGIKFDMILGTSIGSLVGGAYAYGLSVQEMKEIAFLLETQKGFNILQCIYTDREVSEEEKQRLAAAHYRKIDLSDGIYVVNIGGYIGESVAGEIEYAKKKGCKIIGGEGESNYISVVKYIIWFLIQRTL